MNRLKKFFMLLLVFVAGTIYAQDTLKVRVMTYNLRFGELASLEELALHIKSFKPDFVALQEVDCKTNRTRASHQIGKDFIAELAYHAGMFGLYGKSIDYEGGYYGVGILSKHPYVSVRKTMLPRPQMNEQRVLLEGCFEIGDKDTLLFASTHLDVKLAKTREVQVEAINAYFKNATYPVIIGGDFNATPDSKAIKEGMKNWFLATDQALTIPSWNPKSTIDYLFGQPQKGWRIISTQTIQSRLSDHLPIITELEYVKPLK